jgi:amino acid adenylation domain-containing protein
MREHNIEAIYTLSPMQQGMLFHALYSTVPTVYLEQFHCEFHGRLDRSAFREAWQRVTDRHPVMRTFFVWEKQEKPLQIVRESFEILWREEDWTRRTSAERWADLERFLEADRELGFELSDKPPSRFALLRVSDDIHHFVWSFHHILLDGWSVAIVFEEVLAYYEAIVEKKPLKLPSPRPYVDFIAWLKRRDLAGDETFWRRALEGIKYPTPLFAGSEPAEPSGAGVYLDEQMELSAALTADLEALARTHRLTLNTLVQGLWALLLSRLSGEQEVVFGATVSGRDSGPAGMESRVGLFINTLPVRVRTKGEEPLLPWLARLQDFLVEMREHEHASLVDIQGWGDVPRGMPLFESILVFENYPLDRSRSGPHNLAAVNAGFWTHTNYPLHLRVGQGKQLRLHVTHDRHRIDTAMVRAVLEQFRTLAEQMVADPGKRLDAYSLVTAEARSILPDPTASLPEDPSLRPLTEEFESWASRTPTAPALRQSGRICTYDDLRESTLRLARSLVAKGLTAGEVVAVSGPPSFGLIAGMLAAFFSGGILLPLDRRLPVGRQRLVVREAGVKHIVYVGRRRSGDTWLWDVASSVVEVGENGSADSVSEPTTGSAHPGLDDAAYVFFTSGTTGTPKGILGTHKGLSHFLKWQRTTFSIGPRDRFSHLTSLSFDAVLREVFLPLTSGASLCLPESEAEFEGGRVLPWLDREQVSILHTVPTLARSWIADAPRGVHLTHLRYVFFSGEALTGRLVRRWREAFPDSGEVVNFYGPTETTMIKCAFRIPAEISEGVQSIGKPLPQTQALVLSDRRRLCGIGEVGEIAIRTPYGTRGYINDAEGNRNRFAVNPFRDDERDVLYYTGDLGRYRPDGRLDFLGRKDGQIKVRGARVEPGEIEAVLSRHETVKEAAADLRKVGTEDMLIAYLVLRAGSSLRIRELRDHLKTKLPEYMIPVAFVELPSLPMTANGKLDRDSLPVPTDTPRIDEGELVPPRTPVEQVLAGVWNEVLGRDRIGVLDNFFDLGGHSLRAAKVVSRIRSVFRVDLSIKHLFENPTVAGLATVLLSDGNAAEVAKTAELFLRVAELSEDELEGLLEEKSLSRSQRGRI